jgi:Dihydrodipicolinate synthetase family
MLAPQVASLIAQYMSCSAVLQLHIFNLVHPAAHKHRYTLHCTATALPCTPQLEIGGGSYVALVTPMTPSGAVDEQTLRALLQWHAASGTDGVVVLGTTGEASTLTDAERSVVLQATVGEIGGKVRAALLFTAVAGYYYFEVIA